MPELPEVETVARLLAPRAIGRTILGVEVHWERTLGGSSARDFKRAVIGAKIVALHRRAKYLIFDLRRDERPAGHLVGHLRMSGRMHIERAGFEPGIHARLALALDDGTIFHFIDVRKFGRISFEADLQRVFRRLGDEPLEKSFTAERLHALLLSRKRRLKPLLLDQSVVAGLGNIYVDESLHRARLHPLSNSGSVDLSAARRLHAAVQKILRAAIDGEGSSFDTFYRTPEGKPGRFQARFRVYGREGKPCGRCKSPIVKFTVGQRGTHVCPTCQPYRATLKPRRRSARAKARRAR